MKAEDVISVGVAKEIAEQFGTPSYAYDLKSLQARAKEALAFPNAFGLTVRFAMKASPNAALLQVFHQAGLQIDASSGFEVRRAMAAGIPAKDISLSTQELPADFPELIREGISFNACSLHQLASYGKAFPGSDVGIRFNPGMGSGGSRHTNVGGPSSSFGIWHEDVPEVLKLLESHGLNVIRIHTHIGSGSDPAVWQRTASLSLAMVRQFPNVGVLNLGGGFKVARMEGESATNMQTAGTPIKILLEDFAKETGRKLHLEIEPGTFLTANACVLVASVQDKTSTGESGYTFLKLDTGMNEILRPSLYGAQHPITIVSAKGIRETVPTVVVGHCCESGDLLTPAADSPAELMPRELTEAEIGDLCLIGGTGAYCSAMNAKNYNSFPEAAEILVDTEGKSHLIRKRQTLEQMYANEVRYKG